MWVSCRWRPTPEMGAEFVPQKVYLKKRGHQNPGEATFSMRLENESKRHKGWTIADMTAHSPGPPFEKGWTCCPAAGRGSTNSL